MHPFHDANFYGKNVYLTHGSFRIHFTRTNTSFTDFQFTSPLLCSCPSILQYKRREKWTSSARTTRATLHQATTGSHARFRHNSSRMSAKTVLSVSKHDWQKLGLSVEKVAIVSCVFLMVVRCEKSELLTTLQKNDCPECDSGVLFQASTNTWTHAHPHKTQTAAV